MYKKPKEMNTLGFFVSGGARAGVGFRATPGKIKLRDV
jgi:hypothetical protein